MTHHKLSDEVWRSNRKFLNLEFPVCASHLHALHLLPTLGVLRIQHESLAAWTEKVFSVSRYCHK